MIMPAQVEPGSTYTFQVTPETHTQRLDTYITNQFPAYSRNFFQQLIEKQCITVNGRIVSRSNNPVRPHDAITIKFPAKEAIGIKHEAVQKLGIQIVFEHEHFFIVYKPAGVLVHAPTVQSDTITLVDWIVAFDEQLKSVGCIDRPGIVHRLDKDTSGLLIVSRTNYAHMVFGNHFRDRTINKSYYAIVEGTPPQSGSIDYSIRRDPISRVKMTAVIKPTSKLNRIATQINANSRDALTHYTCISQSKTHALLDVKPVTGRTHQIRVHCTAIGHPLVGDYVYGSPSSLIARHALHAYSISFVFDGQQFSFNYPMPNDMLALLQTLSISFDAK
jgi:23S rRNA pseudouridine1911/1915/1917 synthase